VLKRDMTHTSIFYVQIVIPTPLTLRELLQQ